MRTILTWYQDGGPFIVPLLFAGLLGLLLLAERVVELGRRSRVNARPFMERVIALARAGKIDEARDLCVEHTSAIPDVGLVLLRSGSRDASQLLAIGRAATLRCTSGLRRRLEWLATLSRLCVVLGVAGAAANLHSALSAAGGGNAMVSAMIYAMRPLVVGLLTAAPLMAGHAIVADGVETLREELEEFTVRLSNALSQHPDERLGHRTGIQLSR